MNDSAPQRIRAFLAIAVAPAIHARLVRLKAELTSAGAHVRWVRDEGLHATLKFLGSIDLERLEQMRHALNDALRSQAPFTLRVRGLGVFPDLRRPRVIWAGLHAAPQLAALARRIEEVVEPFGFPPERRPFQPHLTLGRVASRRGWRALEELLERHRNDDWGDCELAEMSGFRSELRPQGSVYTRLWTIPLGGSRGGRDGSIG